MPPTDRTDDDAATVSGREVRPGALQIHVHSEDVTCRIALVGELDLSAADTVKAAFARAVAGPSTEIVVDLSRCTFMDSTGIGALISLNRRISRTIGRDLLIVPGPPRVQRVFAICDLLDFLPFAD